MDLAYKAHLFDLQHREPERWSHAIYGKGQGKRGSGADILFIGRDTSTHGKETDRTVLFFCFFLHDFIARNDNVTSGFLCAAN